MAPAHHSKALDLLFHLVLTGGWREAEGRRDLLCSERFALKKAGGPRAGPKAGPAARPGRGAGPAAAFFPPAMRGHGGAEACSGKKMGRFCPPR